MLEKRFEKPNEHKQIPYYHSLPATKETRERREHKEGTIMTVPCFANF